MYPECIQNVSRMYFVSLSMWFVVIPFLSQLESRVCNPESRLSHGMRDSAVTQAGQSQRSDKAIITNNKHAIETLAHTP